MDHRTIGGFGLEFRHSFLVSELIQLLQTLLA